MPAHARAGRPPNGAESSLGEDRPSRRLRAFHNEFYLAMLGTIGTA
jgi:hypothetical protein